MDIQQLMQIYLSGEETYESGEIIIQEGSTGDWIYIILEGQAKVTKRTEAGILTLDTLKKGAIFGEMALLGQSQERRSASVIAADGPVKLGVLDFELLLRDYESLSHQLRSLIHTLVMRLKKSNERVAALVVAGNLKRRQTG
ncbi:MAG: cyclic nucleotide-binding domain-containing protein [Deltaproteobacteria bacterium]|jgi:CRP-like cAMP-binding protein|nr:cyclic nucleotide-binding domain-containing protein [Deltaproteobacteria bacterium]